jgi:hypothetical protein
MAIPKQRLDVHERRLRWARNAALGWGTFILFGFILASYKLYQIEMAALSSDNLQQTILSIEQIEEMQQRQQIQHLHQSHLLQQQFLLRGQNVPDDLKEDYLQLHSAHVQHVQAAQLQELHRLHALQSQHRAAEAGREDPISSFSSPDSSNR